MSEASRASAQGNEQLADRIRKARVRLEMTQQELADKAGLPASQTVSYIEKGDREVKAAELARIAEALYLDITDLLVSLPAQPEILWREPPTDEKVRREIEARLLQLCRHYRLAEEWAELARTPDVPQIEGPDDWDGFGYVEEQANRARAHFGLGSVPAAALLTVLEENAGIKVLYEKGLPGSAACYSDRENVVIFLNAEQVPWRRNYSAAHELFHLLTWTTLRPNKIRSNAKLWIRVEQLANAFASALLLPADSLLARFAARRFDRMLQPIDIVELAREFCVSSEAVVWRLVNLDKLPRSKASDLLENSSFRALDKASLRPRQQEPALTSERFFRVLMTAYAKGNVSVGRVAEMTGMSLSDAQNYLIFAGEDGAIT